MVTRSTFFVRKLIQGRGKKPYAKLQNKNQSR